MPTTPNYGWIYPTDGGSVDVWGDILNTAVVAIDATVNTVDDAVGVRLPLAGGTMSGRLDAKTSTATIVAFGTVSGAISIDCSAGQGFTADLFAASTFSFINVPSGLFGFLLRLSNGSVGVTWPASVDWAAGAAPTLSGGADVLGFVTFDSGTTWFGVAVCLAAA